MNPQDSVTASWNCVHPEDVAQTQENYMIGIRSGDKIALQNRIRNAAGEYRWTLGRAFPIKTADGEIHAWLGFVTDVHEILSGEIASSQV